MKFLIVDDDFTSRKMVASLLAQLGQCDLAATGVEAIEAYTLSLQEENPYQVIFLDIVMPNMTGIEVLQKIRALEADQNINDLSETKVIITSILNDFATIKESFAAQCDAYLIKPITKKNIFETLNHFQTCFETN